MTKRFLSLWVFISLITVQAQAVSPSSAKLKWKNVSSHYIGFSQIKPALLNEGEESIFLSRIWPHGYAQLMRFNDKTKSWELGNWGIGCGTVNNATVPIEIKSKTEQAVYVYWQLSADDWDNPKHFMVEGSLERRPIRGKYKFFLRYALKPWTLAHRPGPIYTIESPEFYVEE